jgi:hypothetical protein
LTTLADLVVRERQAANSSPQTEQLLTRIEKSIGHCRDVLKDLRALAVGYAQEVHADAGSRATSSSQPGVSRPDPHR